MAQGCNLLVTCEDAKRLGLPSRPPRELCDVNLQELTGKEAAETTEERAQQLLQWAVEQLTPGQISSRTTHDVRLALLAVRMASREFVAEKVREVLARHIFFNYYTPKAVNPLNTDTLTHVASRDFTFRTVTGQELKLLQGQPLALTVNAAPPRSLARRLWDGLSSLGCEIRDAHNAAPVEANPTARLVIVSEDFFAIPEQTRAELVDKYATCGASIVVGLPKYDDLVSASWAGLWPSVYRASDMAQHSWEAAETANADSVGSI